MPGSRVKLAVFLDVVVQRCQVFVAKLVGDLDHLSFGFRQLL